MQGGCWNAGRTPVNTDELEQAIYMAERRVLEIQAKLHRWAVDDPHRRFGDLFNLVADPAFLLVAWNRVRGNKGAKTAGVDGHTAASITARGVEEFLGALRTSLKDRSFSPLPSRERLIPKPGTAKRRRLGISTIRDRVVQASLKLVLEPIFEADFLPCSYGFRPGRRVHDAVAEVRHLTSHSYEWIVEGDIRACFDEISHVALQDRVRARIADRRVLALVKAFLKAGILTEDGMLKDTDTGTPQGLLCAAAHKPPLGSPLNRSCAGQRPAVRVGVAGPNPGLTCGFCIVGRRSTPVRWRPLSRLMNSAGLCAALACRAWWGPDRRASAAHNPEDSGHAARQGAGPRVIGGRPDGRFACAGVWPGRGTGAPGLQRLDDGVVPGPGTRQSPELRA